VAVVMICMSGQYTLAQVRRFDEGKLAPTGREPQISPLRYAPVEMTILFGNARSCSQDELSSFHYAALKVTDNSVWECSGSFPNRIVISTGA
jgi:hypothetical protein